MVSPSMAAYATALAADAAAGSCTLLHYPLVLRVMLVLGFCILLIKMFSCLCWCHALSMAAEATALAADAAIGSCTLLHYCLCSGSCWCLASASCCISCSHACVGAMLCTCAHACVDTII